MLGKGNRIDGYGWWEPGKGRSSGEEEWEYGGKTVKIKGLLRESMETQ